MIVYSENLPKVLPLLADRPEVCLQYIKISDNPLEKLARDYSDPELEDVREHVFSCPFCLHQLFNWYKPRICTLFEKSAAISIYNFHTIFPSQESVLNQEFVVLGNGLHWEDGVLFGGKYDEHPTMPESREEIAALPDNNLFARLPRDPAEKWYGFSDRGVINEIPDDVEQSFLDAAWYTANLVAEAEHPSYHDNGKEEAERVKKMLMSRFKDRITLFDRLLETFLNNSL